MKLRDCHRPGGPAIFAPHGHEVITPLGMVLAYVGNADAARSYGHLGELVEACGGDFERVEELLDEAIDRAASLCEETATAEGRTR